MSSDPFNYIAATDVEQQIAHAENQHNLKLNEIETKLINTTTQLKDASEELFKLKETVTQEAAQKSIAQSKSQGNNNNDLWQQIHLRIYRKYCKYNIDNRFYN